MRLLIVIVNYRSASLTGDCLRSLESEVAAQRGGAHVVVIENASGDDSAVQLRKFIDDHHFDGWVTLRPLDKNGGFAAGNNAGIGPALRRADPPDYFLLLNPDTLVHPNAVTELVDFMDAHPEVGVAGSRLENPDATPRRSAFRFPTALSELDRGLRFGPVSRLLRRFTVAPEVQDQPHEADWVAGASMIVRREVFERIGLMDEGYFLYYEETDFCRKARDAGWRCWYVPASRVVHLVGQSTGVTGVNRNARPVPRYWFESRRRYFLKHHGRLYTLLADALWLGGAALWRVRGLFDRGGHGGEPPHLLRDFTRYSLWPSFTLRGAR